MYDFRIGVTGAHGHRPLHRESLRIPFYSGAFTPGLDDTGHRRILLLCSCGSVSGLPLVRRPSVADVRVLLGLLWLGRRLGRPWSWNLWVGGLDTPYVNTTNSGVDTTEQRCRTRLILRCATLSEVVPFLFLVTTPDVAGAWCGCGASPVPRWCLLVSPVPR